MMMKKLLFIVGIQFFILAMGMQMPQPQPAVNIQLGQAIIDGNLPMVRLMLAQGADPNKSTVYGEPVLKFAVINRQNVDIVKALLDAGADPSLTPELLCDVLANFYGGTVEAKNTYHAIRGILISHPKTNLNCMRKFGQRSELTPLMFAIEDRDYDLADILIKTSRVDINVRNAEGKTALDFATNKQMRQWLIMQGAQSGSEFAGRKVPAAAAGSMGAAPAAAQSKAGQKRKEAEHMKAFTGEFKVPRPEIPAVVPQAPAPQPIDPFKATIDALLRNDIAQALNYLNKGGFDINREDPVYGRILSLAIHKNALQVVQRLMQMPQLQINYKNVGGRTPLMSALPYNFPGTSNEIVYALLARPDLSSINEMDIVGSTALDSALRTRNFQIVQVLRSRGAKTGLELRGGPAPQPQPQPQPPAKKETTSFPVEVYAKLGLLQGATPYQVLGVASNASDDQIQAAFKAKIREWHPDKNPDPRAKEVVQLINWAYGQIKK